MEQDQKSTRCDGSKLIDSRDVNHLQKCATVFTVLNVC